MVVVKLGGAALKASLENATILENLARFKKNFLIVHGGGPAITNIAKTFNIESTFVDGQRVTTPELMDVVEMVLSGSINSKIVRTLQRHGRMAMGISGTDAKLLECEVENPALKQVGKVSRVNTEVLQSILASEMIPVVSPVGLFEDFSACNVNADLAATRIASDLRPEKFLFITDTDGIYNSANKTIPEMYTYTLQGMCDSGDISGGMKVKARAILEYLTLYPKGSAQIINGLDKAAFENFLANKPTGTTIRPE